MGPTVGTSTAMAQPSDVGQAVDRDQLICWYSVAMSEQIHSSTITPSTIR